MNQTEPPGTLHESMSTMNEPDHNTIELEIEPTDVHRRLDAGQDLVLLDCRTDSEWAIGHLEHARLIPLQEMSLRMHELDDCKDRDIVVYCHKGARSLIITRLLRHHGFQHAKSMTGGIDRWSRDIDDSIPLY